MHKSALPLRAVLFDLDGTLLDTHKDLAQALNQTLLAQAKAPLPLVLIREHVSNGATALVKLGFGTALDAAQLQTLREQLLAFYLDNIAQHTVTFTGIDALLAELIQHNLKWGIVTNKPRLFTDALLTQVHLPYPPDVVVCPDDVGIGKPDPRPLLHACQHLGLAPAEVLYVGDHRRDVEGAHNAGMQSLAVGYGFIETDDDHRNWDAQFHAQEASDIWPIVQTLL